MSCCGTEKMLRVVYFVFDLSNHSKASFQRDIKIFGSVFSNGFGLIMDSYHE